MWKDFSFFIKHCQNYRTWIFIERCLNFKNSQCFSDIITTSENLRYTNMPVRHIFPQSLHNSLLHDQIFTLMWQDTHFHIVDNFLLDNWVVTRIARMWHRGRWISIARSHLTWSSPSSPTFGDSHNNGND